MFAYLHERRELVADALLALAVTTVLSLVVSADQSNAGPVFVPQGLAYLWAAGMGVLMLIRRRSPVLVLALTILGFLTYYVAGFPAIGVAVPLAAALFSTAEQHRAKLAVAALVSALAVSTAFRLASGQDPAFLLRYELVNHLLLGASMIALGYSVRARRELMRSQAGVARMVAAQTAAQADLHARAERLRLARELHDSIGHSLAVASLFTDVARECHAADAGRRDSALSQVRTSVSEALDHLRSTVALLRTSDAKTPAAPGLDRESLRDILEAPISAGYDVDWTIAPGLRVPGEVGRVAYRVVQEAVTNTLKHSEAERICVNVSMTSTGHLSVEVADCIGAPGEASEEEVVHFDGGQGLAGMRERVAGLGGSLTVAKREDGWTVRSLLPMTEAA